MEDITTDIVIDVRHLTCPRPLLTAKQTLEGMQSGQTLKVIATDTTTTSSFPPFLKRTGDELLDMVTQGGEILIFIRKK